MFYINIIMYIKFFLYCLVLNKPNKNIKKINGSNNNEITIIKSNRHSINRTSGNDERIIAEPYDEDQIVRFKKNLYKYNLIKKLESNISELTKMNLIEELNKETPESYSPKLFSAGLLNDWNFTIF